MLVFDEESHTYSLDGQDLCSVSSVVASQFRKFNSHAVSRALSRSRANDKDSEYFGMSQDDILQRWHETGQQSRDAGIKLHRQIEEFYKHGMEPEEQSVEWQHFTSFRMDHPEWECVATEYRVHNKKVAGTIDAVFNTPDGVVLVDWKRTKSIDYSGFGQGKNFMRHVADCNYSKYSLQLSLYKQLIHLPIIDCYIVQIHPSLETYQKIKAQYFDVEAKALIK